MTLLIAGLVLWSAAHVLKRVAPGARAALTDRMGDASKGLFAVALVLSIVLMTFGYQNADGPVYWARNSATTGINNLLVLLGFYFFAASGAKTRVVQHTRHPQLIGFSLWAGAHLLVNGDLAGIILFGGLLIWALAEMVIISSADGPYDPPPIPPVRKEISAIVIAVILYAVVAGVHTLLGYFPFGA